MKSSNCFGNMARYLIATVVLVVNGLGLVCWARVNDDRMSGSDWNLWYDRLFAHDRTYTLDEARAMSILMKLKKGSYQPIHEDKNKTVRFWYDANVYKLDHCSEDYVNGLYTRYIRHEPGAAPGVGILYGFTDRHIVLYCFDRFTSMDMASLNKYERAQLSTFGALFNEFQDHDRRRPDVEWRLGNIIGSLVDTTALLKQDDFVNAWRSGVCNKVLTRMDEPDMHDYSFVEKFLATIDYKKRQKVSEQTNNWVSAIEACRYFGSDENLSNIWPFVQDI